ncbi:hypothetical protein F4677DRAFT_296407 [Hypoxylon crocopeplum]|nr:hypothetical protein F4677DRAFT_296407 [Hypoxylon crocopeplum]
MKPVTIAHFSQGRLTNDTLLFLNTTTLRLRYVTRLLTHNNTNLIIRSKGGKTLPNEIWAMILNFAKDMKDSFCLVKADIVTASPNITLLRCFRHKFDRPEDELLAGGLNDSQCVFEFEQYLSSATQYDAEALYTEPPELLKLSGPDDIFDVVLDTTSTDPCLFTIRDVPDLIATIDDGGCWVCLGERFICPGCTGGKAQKFGAFMGCGVELACPLCMGIEFSSNHEYFLETYYSREAPKDKAEDMLELLEERLEELGYMDVEVPEDAWKGGTQRGW